MHDYYDLNYEYSDYDTTLESDYREPIIILENNVQEIVSCSSEKPVTTADGKSINFKSPDGEFVNVKISLTDKSLKPNVFITFDKDDSGSTVTPERPDHVYQDSRNKRGYNNTQDDDTYNEILRKNSQKGILNEEVASSAQNNTEQPCEINEECLSKVGGSKGQVSSESHKTGLDDSTDDIATDVGYQYDLQSKNTDNEDAITPLIVNDDIGAADKPSDNSSLEIDNITLHTTTVASNENSDITNNDTLSETGGFSDKNVNVTENEEDEHFDIASNSTLPELDDVVPNHGINAAQNKHIDNSDVLDNSKSSALNETVSVTQQNKTEDTTDIGGAEYEHNEGFGNTGDDISTERSDGADDNTSLPLNETVSVAEQKQTEGNIGSAEYEQNESINNTRDDISPENDGFTSDDVGNERTSFETDSTPSNASSGFQQSEWNEDLDIPSTIASSELEDAVSNDGTSAIETEPTENSSMPVDGASSNESTITTEPKQNENSDIPDIYEYTSYEIDDVTSNESTNTTENEQTSDNNKSSELDDAVSNHSIVVTETEQIGNSDIPHNNASLDVDSIEVSEGTINTGNEQTEKPDVIDKHTSSVKDQNEDLDILDDYNTSSEVHGTSSNENTNVTELLPNEPIQTTSDINNQNYSNLEDHRESEDSKLLEVVETKLSNSNGAGTNVNESPALARNETDVLQDTADENVQGEAVNKDNQQEGNENSGVHSEAATSGEANTELSKEIETLENSDS